LLIRVADLVGINRRLGRETTDEMLRRVGSKSRRGDHGEFPDSLPARMNGADFALLLPGQRPGRKFAEEVLDALVKVMEPFTDGGTSAYIGVGGFDRGTALRIVLAQVDSALIAAEAGAANSVQEAAIDGGTICRKATRSGLD
jgi:GGDEF domain-containing protein